MSAFDLPVPLADIESVLAWVDTFKLSRPTKKINRDFSDAVLLAEILSVNYPKLVEMHNYPPRNSHALKLNNWMTLNRKVLKKLKLNLCCSTMEQLANSAPGMIERVLLMVRDKIRRDEDANKTADDNDQNMSSGGSYYEASGDDEHVLVVPVKTRVNGVLETIQQKVVTHEAYLAIKTELKDSKDCTEVLKSKVEHLDNLLKLKEERIEELQKQLERKQTRRKEVEALQNSLSMPFDSSPPTPKVSDIVILPTKIPSLKSIDSASKIPKLEDKNKCDETKAIKTEESKSNEDIKVFKEESKIPVVKVDSYIITKVLSKPSFQTVTSEMCDNEQVDKNKSDVFKEIEIVQRKLSDDYIDVDDFKDSEEDAMVTIEDSIQKEIKEITNPMEFANNCDVEFQLI
ncbi:hypothetical protein MSG28_014093 [Choristoneura fumiferana]|uniref:Uncharacterized protein n=1 Tax=Choristoneura fumiferana TaxID=7141 RepID=A0ACC0JFT0_CHOFU|nr:hypothetical protein MSG28_014093 [Choristoneura fumiferana]